MGYVYSSHSEPKVEDINKLIFDLGSYNGLTREKARQALIQIGNPAVNSLVEALKSRDERTRWEAAKALVKIHSPIAAPALVEALRDDEADVRWLGAMALVAMEREALEPLLDGLKEHVDSVLMREGAFRVLRILEPLLEVIEALEGPEPEARVPWAVDAALKKLREV